MVVRREKKTRKYRGSRTHGWGKKGQHRDRGSQGSRPIGQHKEKWSWVVKYAPDWYGKHGFVNPTSKKPNVITMRQLLEMINSGKVQPETQDGKTVIDLEKLNIDKLIGRGTVPKGIVIKVKYASKGAQESVRSSGGEIILTSQ